MGLMGKVDGEVSREDRARLVVAAMEVRRRAHAPYSRFRVGAAILGHDGSLHVGCNVENASYGLTVCAERGAVSSAIALGSHHWRAIAIASRGGVTPCGACRQTLSEFASDLLVVCIDATNGEQKEYRLAELLPQAFGGGSLDTETQRPYEEDSTDGRYG
jgi:cytidine deaminase